MSPMPFGWGANPNPYVMILNMAAGGAGHQCLSAGGLIQTHRHMGNTTTTATASHQCLSAGGLIQTPRCPSGTMRRLVLSPMPFGWGANPNGNTNVNPNGEWMAVTNAFRLGG